MVHPSVDQNQQNATITTVVATTTTSIGREEGEHVEQERMQSIYETYHGHKTGILIIVSCLGFLSTFDEIIYVPALPTMIEDLHTTETLGFLSVAVYFFAIGISSIFWGVLADYYGRKPVIVLGLVVFILSTFACYFSPNIYIFLVDRGVQGFFVSTTAIVGQAIIADVYDPDHRGGAYGIFYAFYFSAAIFAPTLGGLLASFYGWRSAFLVVATISLILFLTYAVVVPETHQYRVVCTYHDQQNRTLLESGKISKPVLTNPCLPFLWLKDHTVILYVAILSCGYLTVNCSILLLSVVLAKPPYSYRENIIGTLFLPIAMAFFSGSIIGGKISDLVAVKWFQDSQTAEGRILPGLIFSILTVVGLPTYGWAIQYRAHVLIVILGQFISAFGQAATRPGILSYFTIAYQENAASISSVINCVQQILTAVILAFVGPLTKSIGHGILFTTLAMMNLLLTATAAVTTYKRLRFVKDPEKKMLL